ncbi:MAG: 16S rRNA (cytosine(967)-C(5))-methyltransferase RsmB, partial [Clostridiales bacterium]|nr:16S rRNA (cytosine(967)-C(5))-methyltransferase RsmB [Clostridiales bacterium]
MKKANEREIAVYALMDITVDGGYNNIVLRKTLGRNDALSQTQKAFITELVNGALRNLLFIDEIINQFASVKTKKMKPLILNILRISVYQIKWMDKTPDFAVLNEAVNIARTKGFANLTGFVNGVLRNMLRNLDQIVLPDRAKTPVRHLSVRYSYPVGLTEKLIDYFGGDVDRTEQMMIANNRPPKLTVCVNPLKTTAEALAARLAEEGAAVAPGQLSPYALHLSGTANMAKLPAFQEGLFHVIDESAMLSVQLLNPKKGQTMLDLCSAPGGKAFFAGYLMRNEGEIIAADIHEHKIALIEASAARLGLDIIKTALSDATVFHEEFEEKADVLLIDAPCSGLGLVRKKPDIKYTKTVEDISALARLQRELLAASWRYVKKGGTLVYSTCTLTKEENEDNMNWFMANFPFLPAPGEGETPVKAG